MCFVACQVCLSDDGCVCCLLGFCLVCFVRLVCIVVVVVFMFNVIVLYCFAVHVSVLCVCAFVAWQISLFDCGFVCCVYFVAVMFVCFCSCCCDALYV